MSAGEDKPERVAVPSGYVLVPVSADQKKTPLRLCALVREKGDALGGPLLILRQTIDARVFLGAIVDAADRVRQWVEIWVQSVDGAENSVPASREALSNYALDKRWVAHVRAFEKLASSSLIFTGWETSHPKPTFLDPASRQAVHPGEIDNQPWRLCQDDAVLSSHGLPAFSTSLARYLHQPSRGAETKFIPVAQALDQLADVKGLVAFNPGGGLIMVREHSPINFEAYVDLLGGGPWEGLLHGRAAVDLEPAVALLRESQSNGAAEGKLFLGRQGRKGRVIETFHLKLRAIADAIESVQAMTRDLQRPLLNVSPESFQVRLGAMGSALPFLWGTKVLLADAGDAVTLPIRSSDAQYFLPGVASGASIYRPESAGGSVAGRGTLRIRKTMNDAAGAMVIEGTFVTQERLSPAKMDLIWLRVNLGGARVDLFANMDREGALAPNEWRVRTIAQRLGEPVSAGLKSAEGVPMPNVPFEMVPLLSTPIDLYGLAVLAVRTMLVNAQTTLPVALDEILSLARRLAEGTDASSPMGPRIRALFDQDKRWMESLGPQKVTYEPLTAQEAFDLIPCDLWWDMLAAIVRMFPGVGPDSTCRDYGDARPAALHRAFDRAIADFGALLVRSRSLIVIDWQYNRKVHAVIRKFMKGIGH